MSRQPTHGSPGASGMITLASPVRVCLRSSLVALVATLGWPPADVRGGDQEGMQAIEAIDAKWQRAMLDAAATRRKAKTPAERDAVRDGLAAKEHVFARQCLDLAREVPNGPAALIALKLVACRSPDTKEG